ncbi:MAG: hypothetical protein LBQ27_01500 [Clostridiales bacterium]|jgi:hypothetical protein|nr:hypothetical protein [Clostridiales bacterium]
MLVLGAGLVAAFGAYFLLELIVDNFGYSVMFYSVAVFTELVFLSNLALSRGQKL